MSENSKNNNLSIQETKEFKLLLNLLEKAEQILSIINLPESSISKYNTLKKMTYDMLNIEFKPLEKSPLSSPTSDNKSISQTNLTDEILYILHFLNIKKTLLIDLILNFIVNNNNVEQEKDLNFFLTSLSEIYNLSADKISSKTVKDIAYETKEEEAKISNLFTKIDQIFMNNFEKIKEMKLNYENELSRIKNDYNRDLSEFKLCLEKNSVMESDIFKINRDNEKNIFFLNKMSSVINETYEKFKVNFPNENDGNIFDYNRYGQYDGEIKKLEFIKNISDKLRADKKIFLNNGNINDFNKDKKIYGNNNYNFLSNNNYNMNSNDGGSKEILSFLPEIQKESDIFHKNFCDLMNYIETNIEGKNL